MTLLKILFFISAVAFAKNESESAIEVSCAIGLAEKAVPPAVTTLIEAIRSGAITADYVIRNRYLYNIWDEESLDAIRAAGSPRIPESSSRESHGRLATAKQLAPGYGLYILKFLEDSMITDTREFPEVIRLCLRSPWQEIDGNERYELYAKHLKRYGVKESLLWMAPLLDQDSLLAAMYAVELRITYNADRSKDSILRAAGL